MPTILFLHSNFPAQFRHLAAYLAAKGCNVLFLSANKGQGWNIPGVTHILYKPDKKTETTPLSPLAMTESHARGAARTCVMLREKGVRPDVIYAASGWGGTWFLRDIFPASRLVGYFEWYYHADSPDVRFGSKREPTIPSRIRLRLRNPVIVNDLLECDACITPSKWQKAQFPKQFHPQLEVIHEGINTKIFSRQKEGLNIDSLPLTGEEEIITWATRGMEPYRGFPQFIEALPAILQSRKDAHVVIAGEDRSCYGSPPAEGVTWKEYMLQRVTLPLERVHFTGGLPYGEYRRLLCCSSVHIYLSRPFVLSWSMLEAMSCECLIVASDTEPIREVLVDEENGLLCDFFSPSSIAEKAILALQRGNELTELRKNARQTIIERFNLADMLQKQEKVLFPNGIS